MDNGIPQDGQRAGAQISPRARAAGIFVLASSLSFALFTLFGGIGPVDILLSVWLGLLVVYSLYRYGYFAERVPLLLPGAASPQFEKMRRTTGRARLLPAAEPRYLTVKEAEDQLDPESRVIGLEFHGHAIAYPLAAMGIRESAHEVIEGNHILVTWWPVSYSARAFVVHEGDEHITERKTVLNSSVLSDVHGNSVVQFLGQTVAGPDRGQTLEQIPVVSTNWRAWSNAHPDTEVMSNEGTPDVDVFERYYTTVRAGLYQQSSKDRRWHDKDTVLGVVVNGQAKAYPHPALIDRPLVQEELGGEPVLIVHERISATAVAFNRTVDGRVLTFEGDSRNPIRPTAGPADTDVRQRIHYDPWFLVDTETGSRWRAMTGECASGRLKGSRLQMLAAQTGFWFAWSRFYAHADLMESRRTQQASSR